MRVSALPAGSAWSHALYPPDHSTGHRRRAEPVTVIDDPDAVDAFFAQQAG